MSATHLSPTSTLAIDLQALEELGLADNVLASRSLLDLEDDWDDRGSPGYSESTWTRAVDFLIHLAEEVRSRGDVRLASADVLPGSSGEIGLELQTDGKRLLLSIPPGPEVSARYYGHNRTKTITTKGTLDVTQPNDWLVAWFVE